MKKTFLKGLSALLSTAMLMSAVPMLPATLSASAADCVIDTGKTYQTIRGFGGINHPEWAGDLTSSQRETAFGNGANQLGFTMLRVFVNPDSSQWNKAVATAKYASEHNVTVFASPWEPPSNLAESGNGNGKLHLPSKNYGAYAEHLNNFGNYMKQNGVNLYSISVQNEPDYAKEWTYWSTDECMNFIADYGDKITSTRLMSPESFQFSPDGASWISGGDGGKRFYKKIMNNSKAMANCDVFGTHFYGTTRDWMDYPDLENCGKELWMTEVYVPNSDANSSDRFPEALAVAENIHNGMCVSNLSAYVWWYIRRQYGPMNEDGSVSKRGAMMAQYSKWVRPGAVRIAATEFPEGKSYVAMDTKSGNYGNLQTMVSAYQLDGQITVVAINPTPNAKTQNFTIKSGETISGIEAYHTTGSENFRATTAPGYNGSSFSASLPAQSVTTFVVSTGEAKPVEPDQNGYYFHDTFESGTDDWTGRGSASVATGSEAYAGSKALAVTGREKAWNGTQKELNTRAFKAGEEYSFSVCAYSDTEQNMMLSLQYTDASGNAVYDHIAEGVSVGGYVQLANQHYTIPAGATSPILYVESESGTDSFYIDEAIGAVAGTAIDGPKPISFTLGDLNGDGKITAVDMTLAKRGIMNGFADRAAQLAADVNKDGKVSVADAVWYAKYLIGEVTDFGAVAGTSDGTKAGTMRTISEYTPVVAAQVVGNEPNDSHTEKSGVAYGTVKSDEFYSTVCGRTKPFNVLLPAGYSEQKQYPVLYVMHGYNENQNRMITQGNGTMATRQIIGNAIAAGEAKDMIVVFPYIYSSTTRDHSDGNFNDENNRAYDNFINVLTKELMPYVESHYSVKTGRENTAITGFSMGGRESLLIGMQRADLFGYVGAICAAPGAEGAFKWDSEAEAPSLLFLTAGSNDTVVYNTPEGYHNNFTKNNVPHIWHYVQGGYHGDNSIHAHLYNFVRAVFQA